MDKGINLRQQKFIEHYLESGNATDALIKAGYTCKHPNRAAHILLRKSYIQAEIDKVRRKMDASSQLTVEYKLGVLHQGIQHYIRTGDFDKVGKLIEITNKMQGHVAPTESINTVTINNELMMIRDLTEEILNDAHQTQSH